MTGQRNQVAWHLDALVTAQEDLVLAFHIRLLELLPAAVRLPGSGRPACRRLADVVLRSAQDPAAAAELARAAGAANRADGIPADQTVVLLRALLDAVRGVIGPAWSQTLGAAWEEYLFEVGSLLSAGLPPAAEWSGQEPSGAPGRPARADDEDDDEDDDGPGYADLMSSITLTGRRESRSGQD